jgi:hypothetical protein
LEKRICELEAEERRLVAALEQAYSLGGDAQLGAGLAAKLSGLRKDLELAMSEWTTLASELS